jgi:hypothetical protein
VVRSLAAVVGAAAGGVAQPSDQLPGRLAAAVVVAGQEARHALLAETVGIGRGWVALEELKRDWAVDVAEDMRGAGPERLQLRAQLVGDRDTVTDEVLARARQRDRGRIPAGFPHADRGGRPDRRQ